MQFTSTLEGDTRVYILEGNLSFTDRDGFIALIDKICKEHLDRYILDFSAVDKIDSSGMGMLVLIKDTTKNLDIECVFRGMRGQVKNLMVLAKLDNY